VSDLGAALGVPGVRVVVSERRHGSLGFTGAPDPEAVSARRRAFLTEAGLDPDAACGMGQVHGSRVLMVGEEHRGAGGLDPSKSRGAADGLCTSVRGVPLLALGADCCCFALAEVRGRGVGAFHAGWRGAAGGVVAAAVAAVTSAAGASPGDLRAVLGPAIGPCCYQVGPEVREAFLLSNPAGDAARFRADGGDRLRMDLPGVVVDALVAEGVPRASIAAPGPCTACERELWFSHRRGDAGRHMLAVSIR
jgi:YfiH family protein